MLRSRLLHTTVKAFAQGHGEKSPLHVFDRHVKWLQKERASVSKESNLTEYLRDEIARRMVERMAFLTTPFEDVLDYSCHGGNIEKAICTTKWDKKIERHKEDREHVKSKMGKITMVDSSPGMLYKFSDDQFNRELNIKRVVADEESFADSVLRKEDQYDLVVSNLSMHWINDLPGVFAKLYHCIKPDRCFIGTMFGGDTLFELRASLQLAEMERYGGLSPRVSPFVESSDVGDLMQKAGFQMLTVDVQDIVVEYPSVTALMRDLQLMGDSNAIMSTPPPLTKDLLIAIESIYTSLYGDKKTGHLPATFRIVDMIGWKPGEKLSQPVARGSANVNLKDALGKPDNK
ncbi:hypothetical protein FOA43_004293 [Brettanomyces nanus]|uniref:Uncharacterized protein n=1 Tax=Eeniella nana TaxID=13502 RepID=A0A875SBJ4_EENNA|nr:uncharacterized protein FOA43_004293 [Brettanomyces nanus]QPG76899.1 hypothetical protein FOA43_004293 [Brettanomyces nanus]